ncbi:MAG: hypothetical protein RMJ51_01435 [Candidatus Calescibacterium sp.]|nr:hypothetical protein [Candidatus Calescibacterium sp.]MCX7972204.1 hypothetical protein [bacterium]MDW8194894.1 hypothetical protein [Candidatus Calescibacterium sp.]
MNIDYLCELAHIELDEKEKNTIQKDITKIINFFSKLQELDLETEDYYYPDHLGQIKYNQTDVNHIDFSDFIEKNSVRESNYFKIPPILKS